MEGAGSCCIGGQFNGYVTEVVTLMKGEWSCYRNRQFMEGEWSCYGGGHFKGGRMVMLKRWPV